MLLFADEMTPDFESVDGLYDALEDKDSFVGSVADLKYAVKYRNIYCD